MVKAGRAAAQHLWVYISHVLRIAARQFLKDTIESDAYDPKVLGGKSELRRAGCSLTGRQFRTPKTGAGLMESATETIPPRTFETCTMRWSPPCIASTF